MEIVIIILLILFNGLLSLLEIALISSRQIRMNAMEKDNKMGVKRALHLMDNPDKYLSTIQVGITLIGILTGLYSGDTFAVYLKDYLEQFAPINAYAGFIAKTIIVLIITYFTIVIGELIPKKIAMAYPETLLRILGGFLRFFSIVFAPLVWILTKSINLFIRILRIKPTPENKITEEEILEAVKMGASEGQVQDVEQDIVERVFDLDDRDVETVMTHRNDLVCIDIKSTIEDIRNVLKDDMYSYYPVIDGHIDNLVGVISLQHLVMILSEEPMQIEKYIEQPRFLPETTSAYKALEQFKSTQVYYALISDEFGAVQGIITSADIMEALLGKMSVADEDEETIVQNGENSWVVDGQYSFYDFLSYFDIEDESQEFEYNTISGLILDLLEHIPTIGETIQWRNFNFEISNMDGARIDKVVVTKVESEKSESTTE